MIKSMHPVRRNGRDRLFVGLATVALITAVSPQVSAQTAPEIHLAAGTLENALLTLSAQTHQQVLFPPELVAGRKSVALNGPYTAEQAIHLLAPGIVVTRAGPGVLVLREAKANGSVRAEPVAQGPFAGEPTSTAPPAELPVQSVPVTTERTAATVSEVEVTGSHIRGAPPASPLVVMSRTDIERTGQSTLAGALQQLPQNFSGGASEGNETTAGDRLARNTNYGTALNLRGLGNNATLVLIDGRRMAGSGALGDFADISTIPSSAVERVEILLDGASAIYGSDAVGGVVNIILRKRFEGAETRLEGGSATSGAPGEFQASQLLGKRWTTGGVMAAFEYQHRDDLPGADRRFASNADLRPLGGSDQRLTSGFPGNILTAVNGALVPTFAIPGGQNGVGLLPSQFLPGAVNLENQRQGVDILPRQTLKSVYLSADQEVGDRLQLTANARYSQRRYGIDVAPATATFSVTKANPFFVSPVGGASDVVGYSFLNDLPNPNQTGSVESLGFDLGGELRLFRDWRAEGYLTYARDTEASDVRNLVNSNALNEATGTLPDNPATPFTTAASGFFNPFSGIPGLNPRAVLDYIGSGFGTTAYRDLVTSANLQIDGTVWDLPGGPLKIALGAQQRRETFDRSGINFTGTPAPVPVAGSDLARSVTAGYVELRIPIFGQANAVTGFRQLDLTASGRIERYSDVGDTANPQFGVLWKPVADLQVRGTFGTSFRAPGLRELGDTEGFGAGLFSLGTSKVRVLQLAGGNPDLKPETAISFTGGIDYRPEQIPGLALSATWFDIDYKNRIDRPVATSIVGPLNDPTLTSFVTFVSPATNAADLAKVSALINSPLFSTGGGVFPATAYAALVDSRYVNTSRLHVRGLDLTGAYGFDVGGDRITVAGNATYTVDYDQQLTPTSPILNQAGVAGFPVRLRSRITADWTRDRLTAGIAFNYIASYRDPLGVHVGDQPTFDLQARLAPAQSGVFEGVAVTFNIRNVFDRAPPFYNNTFGVGYDPTNADPVGRFASIQLVKAW